MNKYYNSKIYVIKSNQTNKIYIGSTTGTISKRHTDHKYDYRRYLNNEFRYITSFEIIKYNDSYIEILEKIKCNNKKELHDKERYYINLYKDDVVNKFIPNRTNKEHYDDNKAQKLEKIKCFKCDKDITKGSLKRHQSSTNCFNKFNLI